MDPSPHEPQVDCRTRLMEAALVLFAEKGYDGTGIREIAQKAQANSAMVQYHFGGKENLYVESMRWITGLLAEARGQLPELPSPEDPEVRPKALAALKGHIALALKEFLTCQGQVPCAQLAPEVWQAAHRVWNREMEAPRAAMTALVLEVIRPFQSHVHGCVSLLRPDLDEEARHLMGLSIHGQLLFVHRHLELIRLFRGTTYGPGDLNLLIDHFTGFTLRGLGLPEATAQHGA